VAVLCILWHKHSRTGSVKVWEFAFYTGRAYANGIICVCVENIKKKKKRRAYVTGIPHVEGVVHVVGGGEGCSPRVNPTGRNCHWRVYIYICIYVCMCEGKPIYSSTDVVHLLLYCIYAYV